MKIVYRYKLKKYLKGNVVFDQKTEKLLWTAIAHKDLKSITALLKFDKTISVYPFVQYCIENNSAHLAYVILASVSLLSVRGISAEIKRHLYASRSSQIHAGYVYVFSKPLFTEIQNGQDLLAEIRKDLCCFSFDFPDLQTRPMIKNLIDSVDIKDKKIFFIKMYGLLSSSDIILVTRISEYLALQFDFFHIEGILNLAKIMVRPLYAHQRALVGSIFRNFIDKFAYCFSEEELHGMKDFFHTNSFQYHMMMCLYKKRSLVRIQKVLGDQKPVIWDPLFFVRTAYSGDVFRYFFKNSNCKVVDVFKTLQDLLESQEIGEGDLLFFYKKFAIKRANNTQSRSVLDACIEKKYTELFKEIYLDCQYNVYAPFDRFSISFLYGAAQNDVPEIIDFLLNAKVNPWCSMEYKGQFYKTVLDICKPGTQSYKKIAKIFGIQTVTETLSAAKALFWYRHRRRKNTPDNTKFIVQSSPLTPKKNKG